MATGSHNQFVSHLQFAKSVGKAEGAENTSPTLGSYTHLLAMLSKAKPTEIKTTL